MTPEEAAKIAVEHSARLVEAMIAERKHPGERMALAIAARAIRRGRHLTDAEKMVNLANAMDDADRENGEPLNAKLAESLREHAKNLQSSE